MNDKMKLHYYSERGMVNSIIQSIYQYKSSMLAFLEGIKEKGSKTKKLLGNIVLKEIEMIDVYDEISLGDFGDPDIIIKITYTDKSRNPILLFIEAKVGTYLNSVNKKSIFTDNSYKNNASRINFQLRLKKRFVDAYLKNPKANVICDRTKDGTYDYKNRKLEKESLVELIKENIMAGIQADHVYYITMTSDEDDPFPCDENYLPFKDSSCKMGYILYDYIMKKPTNESADGCVLHNKRLYDMFLSAKNLANNITLLEEEGEI